MVDHQKRKIAVLTGTRAEYGLLYWLMREIQEDPELTLQIIVTGMHLSPEFGLTYKLIEADGFCINEKVEMLLSSDTTVGVAKSIGLGVIGFADALNRLNPSMLVLLGDRFEALAAAQAALAHKIPIAHIHGGELSEGALDDAMRHSITKMSHLHFVAAELYRKRVIQLGERPDTVFNVGAPGLERIKKMQLLTRDAWERNNGFQLEQMNFLVTYLPATLSAEDEVVLNELFKALDHFKAAKIIFTKANADAAGRLVNVKIDQYVAQNLGRSIAYVSLGDMNYLSLLKYVDVVIGNSSSGLIEVPIFKKPTINIGNRQANRLRTTSVIDCAGQTESITAAIKQAMSPEFQAILQNTISCYAEDATSSKIKNTIKQANLSTILQKRFYDL